MKGVKLQYMRRQYALLQMEKNEVVVAYASKMQGLVRTMKSYGEVMIEKMMNEWSYRVFRSTWADYSRKKGSGKVNSNSASLNFQIRVMILRGTKARKFKISSRSIEVQGSRRPNMMVNSNP